MRVLILGYGTLGALTAQRLVRAGHQVTAVRRSTWAADEVVLPGVTPVVGDGADEALHRALHVQRIDVGAVLVAANPGLRRGCDNGVERIVAAAVRYWPEARLVYTGTTSVYGDAAGATVAEDGRLDTSSATQGLLAIERAVLAHPRALALRITALVGPSRTHAQEQVRAAADVQADLVLRGDPDRPFSWLHEDDAADIAQWALVGAGNTCTGILNAAAPGAATVREYYQHHAERLHVTVQIRGNGTPVPARAIDAQRLHRLLPTRQWLRW